MIAGDGGAAALAFLFANSAVLADSTVAFARKSALFKCLCSRLPSLSASASSAGASAAHTCATRRAKDLSLLTTGLLAALSRVSLAAFTASTAATASLKIPLVSAGSVAAAASDLLLGAPKDGVENDELGRSLHESQRWQLSRCCAGGLSYVSLGHLQ